jgi:hypothetical protein
MSDGTRGLVKQSLVDGQNCFSCAAEIMAEQITNYIVLSFWTGLQIFYVLLAR